MILKYGLSHLLHTIIEAGGKFHADYLLFHIFGDKGRIAFKSSLGTCTFMPGWLDDFDVVDLVKLQNQVKDDH